MQKYIETIFLGLLFIVPGLQAMEAKSQKELSVLIEEELLADFPSEVELSQSLGRELWFASMRGDAKKVKELLENQSTDVNYRLPEKVRKYGTSTPLMIAMAYNRQGIVALLLKDVRVNIALSDKNDNAAVHIAVRRPECLDVLLAAHKAGALNPSLDITAPGFGGRTVLHSAFGGRNWSSAHELSSIDGIDPNAFAFGSSLYPLDALKRAYRKNHDNPALEKVEYFDSGIHAMLCKTFFNLIEKGLSIGVKSKEDSSIFSPCLDAQYMGCVIWPLLCMFGGSPTIGEAEGILSAGPTHGRNPQDALSRYLLAVLPDRTSCMEDEFADAKRAINYFMPYADLVGRDSSGFTPCMIVAAHGELAIFELFPRLLEADSINEKTWNGWGAIHFAAYNGRVGVLQLLLSLPQVDVWAKTDSGLTIWDVSELGCKARIKAHGELDDAIRKLLSDYHNKCIYVFKTLSIAGRRSLLPKLPSEILIQILKHCRLSSGA